MSPYEISRRTVPIGAWTVLVESHRLDGRFLATVSEAETQARIARGEGASRDDAERIALEKATSRIGRTRRPA